jgi:hypothetical protein
VAKTRTKRGNGAAASVLQALAAPAKIERFRTGTRVPESGIYRVIHYQHRPSHGVTLLQGSSFPPCRECGDHVWFELLRAVHYRDFLGLNLRPEPV